MGEPAAGEEGFGGDDARTTIFDYWSLPELTKWVNGNRYDGGCLSDEQKNLREWYGKLLAICAEPALAKGWFYGLNHANVHNPLFGRVAGETASGHWLYAFLRSERKAGGQNFLVVVNLHGTKTMRGVQVWIPPHALQWLGDAKETFSFEDRLGSDWRGRATREDLPTDGLALPSLPPCSALYLEMR